jgi:hypothetical protein
MACGVDIATLAPVPAAAQARIWRATIAHDRLTESRLCGFISPVVTMTLDA